MRTEDAARIRTEKPHIAIIDSKKLRQAGIIRLLDGWASSNGLTVRAIDIDSPIESHRPANCAMIILNLGSASVQDPHQQALIKSTRKFTPRAPLVILSDREEPKEVCAAFESGAAGYMPTSVDPSVALEALSFIKSGGSFFPPSALHIETAAVPAEAFEEVEHQAGIGSPKLSAKQEQVLRLLCQGLSNKVIASQLGMSVATVKVHLRCIMRKLGVRNRTQVAIASIGLRSASFAALCTNLV